jgi:hypothetical protein
MANSGPNPLICDILKWIIVFIILESLLFASCWGIFYESEKSCFAQGNNSRSCAAAQDAILRNSLGPTASLSILATTLMLARFIRNRVKQFQLKLIATLTVFDFCYSLKSLVSTLSINSIRVPGSSACYTWAWVDQCTAMVSQGWNVILMLNLVLLAKWPSAHKKWSSENHGIKLYSLYILIAILPALVMGLAATYENKIRPVGHYPCQVDGSGPLFFLLFCCCWGVFTVVFTFRYLGIRLLEVGGADRTRCIIQLVVFTLSFTCTWIWYLVLTIFTPNPSSQIHGHLNRVMLLADRISFGLVGFTNSCLWYTLTRTPSKRHPELENLVSSTESLLPQSLLPHDETSSINSDISSFSFSSTSSRLSYAE